MSTGSWAANKQRQREQWKAPFCGCFDDMSSCLLSFCFPCVQYGYNAEKIDGSGCFGACCMYLCCMLCAGYQCAIGGSKRTSMRNMYMLEESCCCDCCVHWCCCWCALSQEARELEIRGPPQTQVMPGSPTINISNVNQSSSNSGLPSPNGVTMMGPNGYPMPVPQQGAYMVGPNGQPMMMYYGPPPPMAYGAAPVGPAYAAQPSPAHGHTSIPMQTFSAPEQPPPSPIVYEHQQQEGERITTPRETSPRGTTYAA